jgi:hypothetical protein
MGATAPSTFQVLRILTAEAVADAVRRRIVPVIAGLALVSLFFLDSCTSCSPTVTENGQQLELAQIAGFAGMISVVSLGLWSLVLAGVLAADHLAEPLSDGSANLVLARPVSRGAFASSRLGGTLGLAMLTAAVLLGASGVLFSLRQGLAFAPVVGVFVACGVSAVTVASLAMAASLWLPRTVTALLVFGSVWGIGILETSVRLGAEIGGLAGAVARYGPPLAGTMIAALGSWVEQPPATEAVIGMGIRAFVWAVASVAGLIFAFRSIELR